MVWRVHVLTSVSMGVNGGMALIGPVVAVWYEAFFFECPAGSHRIIL
jgi:hypothetical protein